MNLDWAFYYDSWLIDKVPDGINIDVTDTEDGYVCNPSSLTCYFGANPIYLYGEGKLFHESLISPSGIAIYPEFLDRPGFEWVNRETFKIDFPEETDFNGNNVEDQHTGYVKATDFVKNVMLSMYGVDCDGDESVRYVNKHTPSTSTRLLNSDDLNEIGVDLLNYALYVDEITMKTELLRGNKGFYVSMGELDAMEPQSGYNDSYYPKFVSIIPRRGKQFSNPDNIVFRKGLQRDIFSTETTYIYSNPDSSYYGEYSFTAGFAVAFRTLEYFREGTILSIGERNDYTVGGFSLSVFKNIIRVKSSDESKHSEDVFYEFILEDNLDFRIPHSIAILFNKDVVNLVIDGVTQGSIPTMWDYGTFYPFRDSSNYYVPMFIGKSATNDSVFAGDIEELVVAPMPLPEKFLESFFEGVPILYYGGSTAVTNNNTPAQLSYNLTYVNPTDVFIPNYVKEDFDKYYLKNHYGHVIIAGYDEEGTSSSYVDGLEPYEDKSLLIPLGYTIDQVVMKGDNPQIPNLNIKVLTKLTSDVHIPIRIHMDFVVPENFYKEDITYTMRLAVRSLRKWLWYPFKKFKTGEFI